MENKTIFDRKYKKLNNGAETILALLNERYSLYVNIKHNKEMKGDENNEEKKTENSSIRPIHNTQKIKTADRGLSNAEVQDYEKLLKWKYIELGNDPVKDKFDPKNIRVTPKGMRYEKVIQRREAKRNNFLIPLFSVIVAAASLVIALTALLRR